MAVTADERSVQAFVWNQWYEYEGSYWLDDRKTGVDRGEPSRAAYAFHVLLGHHGILSLTPIWLLSLVGAGLWLRRGESGLRGVTAGIVLVTRVCLAFYLARPLADRNYGGVCLRFPLDVLVYADVAVGDDPRSRRDRRAASLALHRPWLALDQLDFCRLRFAESLVSSMVVRILEFLGLDPVSGQARSRFWFWFRLFVLAGVDPRRMAGGQRRRAAKRSGHLPPAGSESAVGRNVRLSSERYRGGAASSAADGVSSAVVSAGAGGRRLG